MFSSEIKIPRLRVAVLVGKKGSIKKRIEKDMRIKLNISKEGDVTISGEDNLDVFNTLPIIKAIGRGFNPEIAMSLTKEDNYLEIVEINNFTKGSAKKMMRLKSRLIGSSGLARKNIEKMTNTDIVIYGKTVGIIGKAEDVALARNAIEKLLLGAPHGNVYRYIEMQKKRFREKQA